METKSQNRPTVGKLASDLLLKKPETLSPIEQMQEQLSDYERELISCVMTNRKTIVGDFYVVVLTKKERLMENVLRNYFFARVSCPTPDYDQAVYRYKADKEDIEFMWVVPSKDTCIVMRQNALAVDPKERGLLRFVLEFYDGTLMGLCKQMNGESKSSILLEH